MEEQAKQVAKLLKLLANQYRLLILCALEDGEKTVTEICEKTSGISMSALSQHLSALRGCGIIDNCKRGQYVYYHIADKRIHSILTVLKENYCKDKNN